MPKTIKQLIKNYKKEIKQIVPNKSTKVLTGLSKVDFLTEGFKKGTLNLVCARKGNGLKAFRNNLLNHNDFETLIFCKEKEEEFFYSYLSNKTTLLHKKISEKDLQTHEKDHLLKSFNDLKNKKFYIKTKKNLSVRCIEKYLKKNETIEFILIENLEAFIKKKSYLLKKLKRIARKYNISIIAFYTLSEVNNRKSYKEIQPNLSELEINFQLQSKKLKLTESIEIECVHFEFFHLVDTIILLFRPEFYNIDKFYKSQEKTDNKAEVTLFSKNFESKNLIVGFNGLKSEFIDFIEDKEPKYWLEKLKKYANE